MLSFIKKNLPVIILLLLFCFLIFYYYFGIFNYNYIVPPGDDPTRHMTEANGIIDQGFTKAWAGSLDPPLFHTLLAITTLFSGFGIVNTALYVVPFIFIISYFAFYFTVKRLFKNQWLAILAMILLVFVSRQPRFAYTLGTYLNLFAGLCLFVFGLAFFKDLFLNKNIDYKKIILCFLFFGGVMLTHSLSTTYMLMTLIFIGLVLLILKLLNRASFLNHYLNNFKDVYFRNYLILLIALLALITPLTYDSYANMILNKFQSKYDLIISDASIGNETLETQGSSSQIVSWNNYEKLISLFVLYFSLIALPFFVFYKKITISKLIILCWFLALFVGTKFAFFILPYRFAIDMTYPLIIIIAFFFIYCIFNKSNSFLRWAKYLVVFLICIYVAKFANDSLKYNERVRLQKVDEKAIAWISGNISDDDVILAYPKTLARKHWGSYIELLTGIKTLPGHFCPEFENNECPWIFNPQSLLAKNFYRENDIDYIYAGGKVLGYFESKSDIDWKYQDRMLKTDFLEKKAEFYDSASLGKIIIFKVDRSEL